MSASVLSGSTSHDCLYCDYTEDKGTKMQRMVVAMMIQVPDIWF